MCKTQSTNDDEEAKKQIHLTFFTISNFLFFFLFSHPMALTAIVIRSLILKIDYQFFSFSSKFICVHVQCAISIVNEKLLLPTDASKISASKCDKTRVVHGPHTFYLVGDRKRSKKMTIPYRVLYRIAFAEDDYDLKEQQRCVKMTTTVATAPH